MAYFQPEGESEDDCVHGDDAEDAEPVAATMAGGKDSDDEDYEYVPAPRRHAAGRAAAATRSSRAATRATAAAAATNAGPHQEQDPAMAPWSHPPPGAPVLLAEVAAAPAAAVPASLDGQQQLEQLGAGAAAALPRSESRRAGHQQQQAEVAPAVAAASMPAAGPVGRGHMVNGPCMNPDCEHPYDSPQWRKGPPSAPVLCNACGTRWLRNGTLKPLVVSP